MRWNDKAIVLSVRRLGEHSAVIHALTRERGLHAGVDKGAFSKSRCGVYQPGNIVTVHWQARLSEHMGTFSCELVDAVAAHVLDDRRKLSALTSAVQMIEKVLHERDSQPEIYRCMEALIQGFKDESHWLSAYVMLEFALLEHSGFGLDLASCAATGKSRDLCYVSPKSGRAVSREAGEPYHEKLLKLPDFLRSDSIASRLPDEDDAAQILDGVRLCGYFLQERVFAPRGMAFPSARKRFVEIIDSGRATENALEII